VKKKHIVWVLALILLASTLGSTYANEYLSIATGGTSGTYYPLGSDIAALLSSQLADIEVTAAATGASQENLRLIDAGEAQLAIVQNDTASYAYQGTEAFDGEPITSFMAIGMLYPELVQLVVGADSDINTIADLKGRGVSLGADGSGTSLNATQLLEQAGLALNEVDARYLSFKESADAFQAREIEAFFVTSAIPNVAVLELAATTPVRLIGIDDASMAALQELHPFFVSEMVPMDTYNGMTEDTPVAAISAILVCAPGISDDLVYEITRALYEDTEQLYHSKKAEIRL